MGEDIYVHQPALNLAARWHLSIPVELVPSIYSGFNWVVMCKLGSLLYPGQDDLRASITLLACK